MFIEVLKIKVLKKCLKVICIYKYIKEFIYFVFIWYIVYIISFVFKYFCNVNNFIWANVSFIIYLYNIKENRVYGYMYYLKKKVISCIYCIFLNFLKLFIFKNLN